MEMATLTHPESSGPAVAHRPGVHPEPRILLSYNTFALNLISEDKQQSASPSPCLWLSLS